MLLFKLSNLLLKLCIKILTIISKARTSPVPDTWDVVTEFSQACIPAPPPVLLTDACPLLSKMLVCYGNMHPCRNLMVIIKLTTATIGHHIVPPLSFLNAYLSHRLHLANAL